MNDPTTWHGMKFQQCIKLFEYAGFRDILAETLYSMARSRSADAKTRLNAAQAINEGIQGGVLAPDPAYPGFLRDVLIDVSRGVPEVPWWHRRRAARERDAFKQRLRGALWLMRTVANMIDRTKIAVQVEDAEIVENESEDVDSPDYS